MGIKPFTTVSRGECSIHQTVRARDQVVSAFASLPAMRLIKHDPARLLEVSGEQVRLRRVQAVQDVLLVIGDAGDALLGHEHWNKNIEH